jgi:hypothetical protein
MRRAVGQPEPGQVERDPAQAARGQLAQHLAIQEGRGRHPVQAQHWLAAARRASLAYETADTGGLKTPPGSAVLLDHVMAGHPPAVLMAAVAFGVLLDMTGNRNRHYLQLLRVTGWRDRDSAGGWVRQVCSGAACAQVSGSSAR